MFLNTLCAKRSETKVVHTVVETELPGVIAARILKVIRDFDLLA